MGMHPSAFRLRRIPLPRRWVNSGHEFVRQASSAGIMLVLTLESKESPRVRGRRRTAIPARRDLRPSPKQRGRLDPDHDRLLEGAWRGGRGLRGLPRTQLRPGLGTVARPPCRRGRTAGGAEHAVGGEHVTLSIERRWMCRGAGRRLAGRRTHELLAARSGRVRPDMGHLPAHNGAPGPRLCLAASGRRRKDNHRTAEWTVTNGHETLHALRTSQNSVNTKVAEFSFWDVRE